MAPPILRRRADDDDGGDDDAGGDGDSGTNETRKRPRVTFDADAPTTASISTRQRPRLPPREDDGDISDDDGEAVYGGVDASYEDSSTPGVPNVDVDLARRRRARRRREGSEDVEDEDEDDVGDGGGEEAPDAQTSLLTDSTTTSTGEKGDVPVEPFNLNQEREGGEGYFDGETYVFRRSAREDAVEPDAWVDTLGEEQSNDAKAEAAEESSSESDAAAPSGSKGEAKTPAERADMMRKLASLLAPRLSEKTEEESVSAALRRYGAVLSRDRDRGNKQRRHARTNSDIEATVLARENLGGVTDLADDLLMNHGLSDVYDLTRGRLLSMADELDPPAPRKEEGEGAPPTEKKKRSYFDDTSTAAVATATDSTAAVSASGTAAEPSSSSGTEAAREEKKEVREEEVRWEYKGQDGNVHGPFTSKQMVNWISAGYFVGPSAVDVRRVVKQNGGDGGGGSVGVGVEDLMADLESDDDEEEGDDGGGGGEESPWMRSDEVDFASHV